jgi:hypothetical protein
MCCRENHDLEKRGGRRLTKKRGEEEGGKRLPKIRKWWEGDLRLGEETEGQRKRGKGSILSRSGRGVEPESSNSAPRQAGQIRQARGDGGVHEAGKKGRRRGTDGDEEVGVGNIPEKEQKEFLRRKCH